MGMNPHEITMSHSHWQSLCDAAESIGKDDQRIIMKITREVEYDLERKEFTIPLWDREIDEILSIVNEGKMYNSSGEFVLKQAMEILRNG